MPVNKKFRRKVRKALNNTPLRTALGNFALSYPQAREAVYKGIEFETLRETIEKTKREAIGNFEELAHRFEEKITARGAQVHRAADGAEVARIIQSIAQQRKAKLCVKSKSMASEEIHLNHRLQDALKVVETDLGEWIIQQIDETPSHMVMPAIHLTKEKCAEIFSDVLGRAIEPDIGKMVKLARQILREQFLAADIGISGCNIAVADTGTMVILTNEGNGRLTSTLPPVHIVLMGYEKLVPHFKDIAPLLAAIPRSATCQNLTSYVTMISAPSETFKGPEDDTVVSKELHVIFLDNGRRRLFTHPVFKQAGQCIRCASCLNVCPVYTMVGGQVYGHIYAGGIGTLLTAFLSSPQDAEKIQELCLNCGKCRETCPGKIDIPGLILELRSLIRDQIPPPLLHKIAINNFLPRKKVMDISLKAATPGLYLFPELPAPALKTFRTTFKHLKQDIFNVKGTIAFFYGCLIDYFYPEIGVSIVTLLNRAGYRVILPGQHCCGAPALYMGLEESAKKIAQENLDNLFEDIETIDYIVTACPTGTAMLKKHVQNLLKDKRENLSQAGIIAEKTIDFIQLLYLLYRQQAFTFPASLPQEEIKITYHYSCHLKRDSGIEAEPREVLSALPGVKWIEMEEADRCCGFAGSYSLKLPEISKELLDRKIKNIEKSNADIVIVDCPGCLLQIKKGLKKAKSKVRVLHSAQFLAQRISAGLSGND